ncbi:MAG: S8 family peptidase [Clostridiales bacterium]|nr:S8 family peptidase [Clostridiales bacterium]
MTDNERNPIISEDYADLLIEYYSDYSVFDQFPNAFVNIINPTLSIVHIPVQEISEFAVYEFGYSAMPTLFGLISRESLEASGVLQIRNQPNFDLRGQGVLIGIIDSGIDYTNPIFINEDGTTRIALLWDQTIEGDNPPENQYYGTEFTGAQINEALQSENPFDIVPSRDEVGHGTMIAGIAGGSEIPENEFSGVASEAEFVVVKLKPAKRYLKKFFRIPEDANCYQETDILFALEYLLSAAERLGRPMAICIALGTSQGAHDGRGILSNYLSLISTVSGIAVVVATGNEGNSRRHYFGLVDQAVGYNTVELNVGENEGGFSMELWGQSPSIFSIDIISPTGERVPRISSPLDENREVSFIFEQTMIYIDFQMVESQSGDQLILIRFSNPTPGIWSFHVYEREDLNMGFHIWLPMDGFISDDTYFIRSDPNTTILSLGNAEIPITITAYNDKDDSLYISASRGNNRLGISKPDVAAPGVNVIGPTLNQGFAEFTGTSVAAAHTAGIAALLLEWGFIRGNLYGISTVEIKKLILRGARRDVNVTYPNQEWGYGILNIYNVFDSLRIGIIV